TPEQVTITVKINLITAKGFVFSYTYSALTNKGTPMKIILWAVLIIFLIGLLVVTGVFKMIF
ncbi:small membrane protein YohP, partial [Escherichia coli]